MKGKYFVLIMFCALCALAVQGQDIRHFAFHIKGPVPTDRANTKRETGYTTQAYLNYMQSDSVYFPLSYYTDYMFYMNSRYDINDTGSNLSNELLLQSFGVMFDTILDAVLDSGYAQAIVRNVNIDSLHIILGQCNHSGLGDTIVVEIDSIDSVSGYITPIVLHADTVLTGITGMSAGNNWLNPFIITVKPNYMLNTTRFGVTVKYFGSKFDTLGFLPGFGDTNCISGGSGPIPKETRIGNRFHTLTENSLTTGYQYFFNNPQTIPTAAGSTGGLIVQCSNPSSKYWYFQDNPIGAYISFNNVTGVNELSKTEGFTVSQNYPNPFSHSAEITYTLKNTSDVGFNVTDLTGRILMKINYKHVDPGQHVINLNAANFSPGIYLYTFNINGSKVSRKMVISQ